VLIGTPVRKEHNERCDNFKPETRIKKDSYEIDWKKRKKKMNHSISIIGIFLHYKKSFNDWFFSSRDFSLINVAQQLLWVFPRCCTTYSPKEENFVIESIVKFFV
jgi:hypothetical protein